MSTYLGLSKIWLDPGSSRLEESKFIGICRDGVVGDMKGPVIWKTMDG
jgi:hypothetical protein